MSRKNIFVSEWTPNPAKHFEKVSNKPSVTVPDESMSLKYILERYTRTRQIDPSLERAVHYSAGEGFDSVDLEEVHRMDLADRYTLQMDIEEEIKIRKAFLEDQKTKLRAEEDRLRSDEATGDGDENKRGKKEGMRAKEPATTSKDRTKKPSDPSKSEPEDPS